MLSEEVSRVVEERLSLRMSLFFVVPGELFRDLMLVAWETFRKALIMDGILVNDGRWSVCMEGVW